MKMSVVFLQLGMQQDFNASFGADAVQQRLNMHLVAAELTFQQQHFTS